MSVINSLITKKQELKPRIVIHGMPGVGKTSFFANAKKPIFIQVEDGLDYLDVEVDAFPLVQSFDEAIKYLDLLIKEDHEYQTVVIDSIDWLQTLSYEKIVSAEPGKSMATACGGYGKGYVVAYELINSVLKRLDVLRQRGMTVGLICHTGIKSIADPRIEGTYDTYDFALQKNNNADINARITDWSDFIGFADKKTLFSKSDGENKARQLDERVLHFDTNAAYKTKARSNIDKKMPLEWGAFVKSFKESTTKKVETNEETKTN